MSKQNRRNILIPWLTIPMAALHLALRQARHPSCLARNPAKNSVVKRNHCPGVRGLGAPWAITLVSPSELSWMCKPQEAKAVFLSSLTCGVLRYLKNLLFWALRTPSFLLLEEGLAWDFYQAWIVDVFPSLLFHVTSTDYKTGPWRQTLGMATSIKGIKGRDFSAKPYLNLLASMKTKKKMKTHYSKN